MGHTTDGAESTAFTTGQIGRTPNGASKVHCTSNGENIVDSAHNGANEVGSTPNRARVHWHAFHIDVLEAFHLTVQFPHCKIVPLDHVSTGAYGKHFVWGWCTIMKWSVECLDRDFNLRSLDYESGELDYYWFPFTSCITQFIHKCDINPRWWCILYIVITGDMLNI